MTLQLNLGLASNACIEDEESAKQELQQSRRKYSAADKSRCIGQTEDGGMPNYVEVLECLLVTINVGNSSLAPPR